MSRHLCTKELYTAFLQASSIRYSGNALSEVAPDMLSHDSISNWLKSRHFSPRNVWLEAKAYVDCVASSALIIDDSTLDKHRSRNIELVSYQYSGNEHAVIPGIGMTNLLWHNINTGVNIPIDFRIYAPEEDGKTKNDHFREMIKLALERGVIPSAVLVDCWYSSLDNLKMLRDVGLVWIMGLKKNRKVNKNQELQDLKIPEDGLRVHLRGYGWITVFRFVHTNGRTDYIGTNQDAPNRIDILHYVKMRWNIEVYHRELKQTCGIERCQARTSRAQRNHILLAVIAWIKQFKRRYAENISIYQLKWDVVKPAITHNLAQIMYAS